MVILDRRVILHIHGLQNPSSFKPNLSSTMIIPPIINIDDRRCALMLDIMYNLSTTTTQQSTYIWLHHRQMESIHFDPSEKWDVDQPSLVKIPHHFLLSSIMMIEAVLHSSYHQYWWYDMCADVGHTVQPLENDHMIIDIFLVAWQMKMANCCINIDDRSGVSIPESWTLYRKIKPINH